MRRIKISVVKRRLHDREDRSYLERCSTAERIAMVWTITRAAWV